MSTNSDHEHELRHALQQQATGVEVVTDFAPKAIARRRRDHRNRLALVASACVAAVAIAVPTVWAVNQPDLVPGPALSTGSVSRTPPSTQPNRTPLPPNSPQTTASAPSASSPTSEPSPTAGIAYAVDNVLHLGSATITLPRGASVEQFARMQAGAVVVSWRGSGPTTTQMLDADGRELLDLGDGGLWVVSRDGTRVASSDGHTVKVLDSAAKVLASRDTAARPIDIVGNEVYLVGDNNSEEWDLVTGATRTLPKDLVAVSPSRERAALAYPESPDSFVGCWAVIDLTTSNFTRLVEKCASDFRPEAFSANGTYLVGENTLDGGFFFDYAIVRADTGKTVFGGTISSAMERAGWGVRLAADERSVWLSANTSTPPSPAKTNSLQRCTIGGACTEVLPSLEIQRSQPRYMLESPASE